MIRLPTFPFEPKIGQRVFFVEARELKALHYYGVVAGRRKDSRTGAYSCLVKTYNSTHTIKFDPRTGFAKPFGELLRLALVGSDMDFKGLDTEGAMRRAHIVRHRLLIAQNSRPVIDVREIRDAKEVLRSFDTHLSNLENVDWLINGKRYKLPKDKVEHWKVLGLSLRDLPDVWDIEAIGVLQA